MKRINLLFMILCCFSNIFGEQIPDSLLVVVIMIKNEAANIRATLKPFLDAGLQNFVVLDTGSTDDTIAITRKAFADYGVKHGYIVQQPFVDFSTSRNYALECAEAKFPQAVFFVMPDAEWYMKNAKGLIKFCKENSGATTSSYLMYLNDGNALFCLQRLFRAHKGIRFVGVVHEMLNETFEVKVPQDIYFEYRPTSQGLENSKRRWIRDKDLLLKEVEKNPNDLRTLFFLGQTFFGLGDLENACLWYKKIEAIPGGWEQERGVVFYRIAQAYEKMDDWNMALCYYLKAYNQRPSRAESLVRIAMHYLNNQEFHLAFIFAQSAVSVGSIDPNKDWFLIEQNLYDYMRYHVLGCAAWHVEEYKTGEKAVRQALKHAPRDAQLLHYLSLFENHKKGFKKTEEISDELQQERKTASYQIAQLCYQAAQSYEAFGDWDNALVYYLKSYDLWPKRIEPLMCIAEHYLKTKELHLSFIFAQRAVHVPCPDPSTDWFLIQQNVYDYDRYDALARAAYHTGHRDIAEQAVRQACKVWPSVAVLHFPVKRTMKFDSGMQIFLLV